MKKKMNRRQLLVGSGAMAGMASFGGIPLMKQVAQASSLYRDDRHFVFCYFPGGWDILLALDPRDPTFFTEANFGETGINLEYGRQRHGIGSELITTDSNGQPLQNGLIFGPAIGAIRDHSDCVAVVNGMSMDTLGHGTGRRFFNTGRAPNGLNASGSSMGTWLAGLLGQSNALPNLVFKTETYNVDWDAWASGIRVASVSDLVATLQPGDHPLSIEEEQQIDAFLREFESRPSSERSAILRNATSGRRNSQYLLDYNVSSLFDLTSNAPDIVALRDTFNVDPNDLAGGEAQMAAAYIALTAGLSRCVSLAPCGGLDTHLENWTGHGATLKAGFDLVASFIQQLKGLEYLDTGESWLEHTTILCYSEFSRTPWLNATGGRDHWLANSCLLAGAGIKPGIYGNSTSYGLNPFEMNLSTGEGDADAGEIVRPQQILRTLMSIAGVEDDISRLRVDPITAMLST